MPKRKAASKLSRLVDDDFDDDLLMEVDADHTPDEDLDTTPPPAKKAKGRPRSTAPKTATTHTTTSLKPASRKGRSTVVVGPNKRGPAKVSAARGHSVEQIEEAQEPADTSLSKEDNVQEEDHEHADVEQEPVVEDEHEQASSDELDSPKTTTHVIRQSGNQANTRAKQRKTTVKRMTLDDGFQYTPLGSRQTKPAKAPPKAKAPMRPAARRQKPPIEPEVEPEVDKEEQEQMEEKEEEVEDEQEEREEEQEKVEEEDEEEEIETTVLLEKHDLSARSVSRSPTKSFWRSHIQTKPPQTAIQQRKAGSTSDGEKGESDTTLRRKLGDMTKKYENMDMKYRNLREVGILEANANVEKLRKQCEANTAASNELIASLKKELAMQTSLAKESRALQKQLQDRDDEVAELGTKIKQMSTNLTSAQNEVKALRMKLAASRTAATNVECVNSLGAGSATKNGGSVLRTLMVGSAEAALAAQIAQLKEDLYSDLTGLIIRDAKKRESDHLYDCIQTGINGTLHFKLAVAHDVENTSFEAAEFHYFPLLDPNRDRDLVDILPEYLSIDITFPRQHAAVFYSRVVDTLTKKIRRAED
ncbi:hypothetical protein PAAG_08399 [Paracoccidioides lutzii Pb01]|uniref:Monopolin complex subunit Csm1/Pcs1 C-terminal domain-containing protein n=1 Tax=Paracoccidioides lutzii (strain ATCC MYA-826 / Pb01) TaxID=502779 RepID=C1HCA8_PARBA|nr:hypothetical protein PAAG_08399 [Paracoccidioides lutzii Pb01]EEH38672.2 hypothetical protein PAAG_08399 [Paracoccidioides lutzii Pb01]